MIRGNIYHVPSVVVDTHVKRISNRLGLTKTRIRTRLNRIDEGTAGRSLDSLEYSYHYIWTNNLQCKKSEM